MVVCLFAVNSLSAMEFPQKVEIVELNKSEAFVPAELGDVSVVHDEDGFKVVKNGVSHKVQNCFLDKELRGISNKQLHAFLGRTKHVMIDGQMVEFTRVSQEALIAAMEKVEVAGAIALGSDAQEALQTPGGYVVVSQMSDGEYSLHAGIRVLGGGFWGGVAGAWVGKFVASTVLHGGIVLVGAAVSCVGTPIAGAVVVASLEGTLGTAIEATTTAVAVAASIAGAVATGPV